MPKVDDITAELHQGDEPDWKPLERLVGDDLAPSFMWMYEASASDGTSIHAYKHRWTRRYVFLATDGRAFLYVGPGAYRPTHALRPLRMALTPKEWEWAVSMYLEELEEEE